jgi:endoglucanase
MQSLVNIIRGAGASNVIQVPGVQYANSMSHFLDRGIRVVDPLRRPQLMADVDLYPNGNPCSSVSCYNRQYGPVARRMPFEAGEIGESVGGDDCSTGRVNQALDWFDQHGTGYYAWLWDTWGGCNQLISSYRTGAPHGAWGNTYRKRIRG